MISCASRWSEGATIRMSLDRSDNEKIAHLARQAIAEDDIPRYARELSRILDLVAQMRTVDTRAETPMSHPLAAGQRLRPDEVTSPISSNCSNPSHRRWRPV